MKTKNTNEAIYIKKIINMVKDIIKNDDKKSETPKNYLIKNTLSLMINE